MIEAVGDVHGLCERGQAELMRMDYVRAERTLAEAEAMAWAARDLDALARLYMPLQEARRQFRQRCGEGTVVLDLLQLDERSPLNVEAIAQRHPHGQVLVAGWASDAPGRQLRRIAQQRGLYLDVFAAAVYPTEGGPAVAVLPPETPLPPARPDQRMDDLARLLPVGCPILRADELPQGPRPGSADTYAQTMALWERLHAPYLAAADAEPDLWRRMEAYRRTIEVDRACELAHQRLSDAARQLLRARRSVRVPHAT